MELRPELTEPPPRIARLPVHRGYPVPWFVAWEGDVPNFRAMDPAKWIKAIQEKRCWVCGDYLGAHLVFVVGPMCGINRTSSEPPSHLECAEWSAVNCPFLSRPDMTRRPDAVEGLQEAAGIALARNPGVTLLWTTRSRKVFKDGRGRPLIELGPPERVAWIARGRNATREEVEASIRTGLPALRGMCEQEYGALARQDAHKELDRRLTLLEALYPEREVEPQDA